MPLWFIYCTAYAVSSVIDFDHTELLVSGKYYILMAVLQLAVDEVNQIEKGQLKGPFEMKNCKYHQFDVLVLELCVQLKPKIIAFNHPTFLVLLCQLYRFDSFVENI